MYFKSFAKNVVIIKQVQHRFINAKKIKPSINVANNAFSYETLPDPRRPTTS